MLRVACAPSSVLEGGAFFLNQSRRPFYIHSRWQFIKCLYQLGSRTPAGGWRSERRRRIEPLSKRMAAKINASAISPKIKPSRISPFQACGASMDKAKPKMAIQAPPNNRKTEEIIPSTDHAIVPVRVI